MNGIVAIAISLFGAGAFAQTVTERLIQDFQEVVPVDLHTARCSHLGYGSAELKVSVPDLALMAYFNHVNPGESAPCVSAGPCARGNEPADLGVPGKDAEKVPLRVQLVEVRSIDSATKTCTRSLEERVSATIRGKAFRHLRSAPLSSATAGSCQEP